MPFPPCVYIESYAHPAKQQKRCASLNDDYSVSVVQQVMKERRRGNDKEEKTKTDERLTWSFVGQARE